MNCNVCGLLLPATYKLKHTCRRCLKAVVTVNKPTPINVIEDKARTMGLSYGQLQAMEYMRNCRVQEFKLTRQEVGLI